jgi:hypothetical protein
MPTANGGCGGHSPPPPPQKTNQPDLFNIFFLLRGMHLPTLVTSFLTLVGYLNGRLFSWGDGWFVQNKNGHKARLLNVKGMVVCGHTTDVTSADYLPTVFLSAIAKAKEAGVPEGIWHEVLVNRTVQHTFDSGNYCAMFEMVTPSNTGPIGVQLLPSEIHEKFAEHVFWKYLVQLVMGVEKQPEIAKYIEAYDGLDVIKDTAEWIEFIKVFQANHETDPDELGGLIMNFTKDTSKKLHTSLTVFPTGMEIITRASDLVEHYSANRGYEADLTQCEKISGHLPEPDSRKMVVCGQVVIQNEALLMELHSKLAFLDANCDTEFKQKYDSRTVAVRARLPMPKGVV